MDHNLFKPQNFLEGQHGVVGDCNGIPMDVRYREETPVFAEKIYELCRSITFLNPGENYMILDYGCGVGRIAKALIEKSRCYVYGVDDSFEMRELAQRNIKSKDFVALKPQDITMQNIGAPFDLCYLVYVLQHVPAIEIREILQRIHYHLKDGGILFYCSSDYRMAIRFDGKGFHDDRYLGVNLREELSRYFDLVGPAFTEEELNQNKIVKTMIKGEGGLAHPALIYKKKKIEGKLFNAEPTLAEPTLKEDTKSNVIDITEKKEKQSEKGQKLILIQKQSPGDIMMATIALRDLHLAYPNEYITDMRTPAQEIFYNNPYITPIEMDDKKKEDEIIEELKTDDKHKPIHYKDITFCNLHYPMIHQSGYLGTHFADSMTQFLSEQLGRPIPRVGLRPEIYLNFNETNWPSPVLKETGYDGKYWVLNAGSKSDFTLKQYPYYQEVVNLLKNKVRFVQIGQKQHKHTLLEGTIDMIGKTNLRELFRVIYKAEGVVSCVAVPMHIAAAFKKPCVVIAGGREGTRWELYPDHRFLYTNGALDCCQYDGCWRSKTEDCANLRDGIPLCMKLIQPEEITRALTLYYEGGILQW